MPGAESLIAAVAAGRWAILTSGDSTLARASMSKAAIPEPPVLITADDVRHGKPNPEPYRLAAARLGLDPASCVVLEDSPAGVASALSAGMRVLALTTTHPAEELSEATAVLNCLPIGVRHAGLVNLYAHN